jgi:hypothetical protein
VVSGGLVAAVVYAKPLQSLLWRVLPWSESFYFARRSALLRGVLHAAKHVPWYVRGFRKIAGLFDTLDLIHRYGIEGALDRMVNDKHYVRCPKTRRDQIEWIKNDREYCALTPAMRRASGSNTFVGEARRRNGQIT